MLRVCILHITTIFALDFVTVPIVCCVCVFFFLRNKRHRKPGGGESTIDSPETLTTLSTQYTGRR